MSLTRLGYVKKFPNSIMNENIRRYSHKIEGVLKKSDLYRNYSDKASIKIIRTL